MGSPTSDEAELPRLVLSPMDSEVVRGRPVIGFDCEDRCDALTRRYRDVNGVSVFIEFFIESEFERYSISTGIVALILCGRDPIKPDAGNTGGVVVYHDELACAANGERAMLFAEN